MFDQAGGEQHNIVEAAPNELKLGDGGKGNESWRSARRWRREVFVWRRSRNKIVGLELSESRRTYTLFEYPLGKPLEANLIKEWELAVFVENYV